jgi:hypothetical protein
LLLALLLRVIVHGKTDCRADDENENHAPHPGARTHVFLSARQNRHLSTPSAILSFLLFFAQHCAVGAPQQHVLFFSVLHNAPNVGSC